MDLAQKKGILDSLRDLRLRAHIKISTLKWLRAKFLTKESPKQHKDCRYHSGSLRADVIGSLKKSRPPQ